ncbi:MAG TPA: EpsD family peptidyl-prolyl cis-trans isomerase [Methylotenera sp.]|nr:EpsD family peptidyl-prolyl cis-trans isomerase [Methylotenera sp.]HPH06317.1 EpsD family peptidyl-prolyl cis-trans isomerase [Methylotenera sp.]HPN00338.1 EpsD family peptidyl-prolyl cis-trans isomerase [Methylotenera sp.]
MGFNQNFVNRVSGRHLIVTLLMFYATFLLAACDKKGADGSGEVKAGQSIVRVNGDEITIHQLNLEMQRANIQPAQQEVAGKQIAKSLVDRQILVQEAVKSKLDRNPNVMQAIESAKAQILAQAYLESKVPSTPPTEAEVVAYRTQHPEIFANRKVYVMDEASFVVDAANTQSVQSLSQVAKTVEDVTAWLDSHQIKFTRNTAAHAAETVPAELLEKFSKMVVGDLIFINGNGRTLVGRMVEIKDMPISDADAKPLVERILTNEKRKKSAEAEMARLRATAQIEYLNKKFEPSTAAKSAAVVEPDSTVKSIDQATSSAAQDKSLEKGLSGL